MIFSKLLLCPALLQQMTDNCFSVIYSEECRCQIGAPVGVCVRLGDQLIYRFERNRTDGKFENICLDDDSRPTSLIRRYEDIYSDERVELLDVLELHGQGHDDDLEQCPRHAESNKTTHQHHLIVSIIVVSSLFRSHGSTHYIARV